MVTLIMALLTIYHSAVKRYRLLMYISVMMELKDIMISGKSQCQKVIIV